MTMWNSPVEPASLRRQDACRETQEYPTMSKNVTQKLIESHWVEGRMKPGEEIDL